MNSPDDLAARAPHASPGDEGISGEVPADRPSELVVEAFAQQVVGPLPPPNYVRACEEIDPGRASKLFDLAEEQARHRMGMEERALEHQNHRSWGGLIAAAVAAPLTIAAGAYVAVSGHPTAGATIATATLRQPRRCFHLRLAVTPCRAGGEGEDLGR